MGSFYSVCCVTKTPITYGEKCVSIAFKRATTPTETLLDDIATYHWLVENGEYQVIHGKYDDYGHMENGGRLNGVEYNQFFISNEAWEIGKKLTSDPDYSGRMKYIEDRFELKNGINELMKKGELLGLIGRMKEAFSINDSTVSIEDIKIITCLNTLCYLNNFNLFESSEVNKYGGQTFNIKEKELWNDLRSKRIELFKSKERKWEIND